jgi:error-prone DNA polymerase
MEKAGRPVGPLLRDIADRELDTMPLAAMSTDERLSADFSGIDLTTGPHPSAYQRSSLRAMGCVAAADLVHCMQDTMSHIAGCVIARQRPGTAKVFVFLSLEDETGIANIILTPNLFEHERLTITHHRFLHIHGLLRNNDGVVHVKAKTIAPSKMPEVVISSHDFH